jgi:hypothetical protein
VRKRERERENVRKREREIERERKWEGERERKKEGERDVEYGCFILFLKGMTGALAPFSYLIKKIY